jgi:hypothetical protein
MPDYWDHCDDDFNMLTVLVTQEAINAYLLLEVQHDRFVRLRERLMEGLEAGAPVEPGFWHVELVARERRALTAADLVAALGLSDEEVRRLKAAAPARAVHDLAFRPVSGGR